MSDDHFIAINSEKPNKKGKNVKTFILEYSKDQIKVCQPQTFWKTVKSPSPDTKLAPTFESETDSCRNSFSKLFHKHCCWLRHQEHKNLQKKASIFF